MILRSLIYGYLGAILAGLGVAVVGVAFGLSQHEVLVAASPTGIVVGVLGFALPWARPALARVRDRRQPRIPAGLGVLKSAPPS